MKSLAIIIPVFNEDRSIVDNLSRIISVVQSLTELSVNILLVDDGSTDTTVPLIRNFSHKEKNVHLLCLTRNFGKEAAIYAGLTFAKKCDAAIVMDGDLQHPPSLLPEMVQLWQQGYDVVEACKSSRGPETPAKGVMVRIYTSLFESLTRLDIKNYSDFKLLDKKVIEAYCRLPERERFFRGLINWMHFSTARIYFDVPETDKKTSSWKKWTLIKYAVTSIVSFTSLPLHLVTVLGGITFLVSVVIGGIALVDKISGKAIGGFTTVILLLLFIGSVLMFSLGIIGIYIAGMYDELKHRPAFIVNEEESFLGDFRQ
jgi:glycosyltransferase involved in cell wall biosynthesis